QSIGTGCPAGSVIVEVAPDKKSFLFGFSQMHLENPNPEGKLVQFKNFLASIRLHVPSGLQASVATVRVRGYAYLDEGITARHTSKYTFAGQPIPAKARADLIGPYDSDYDFSDLVPPAAAVWSKCGSSAIFGIDTQLQLDATANPTGAAIVRASGDEGINIHVLRYRRC